MALIDFDKFLASFITEMKECSQMRNFSIPRCIKKALVDQGLDYKGGEIIKTQCRVSAEAKENGYGESKDERIRKEIIAILQYKYENFSKDPKYCNAPQWIAWLEKQGQSKKTSIWKHWKDGVAGGSEGEQIFLIKSGLHYSISSCLGYECDYIELSELDKLSSQEKQGQKPITFNNAHVIGSALNDYCCKQYDILHKENGGVLSFARLQHLAMDIYGWCKEQGEQKPADKVEPKLHIGDWVVWDNKISCHIDNIYQGKESLMYTITDTNNMIRSYSVKSFDNNARLWTIQDAKDGDVLAEDSCIFIIQKYGDNTTEAKTYYTLYDDGDFDDGTILYFDIDSTKPATKEQRDMLFQKMHEAGYTFDFEKKELKKLKFRVGDEVITENEESLTITRIDEEGYWSNDLFICDFDEECIWDLVEQKPTWSEEDDMMLEGVLDKIGDLGTGVMCKGWLKSLKDRVQPQNNIVTDKELAQAKKEAYNETLDKIEYNSGEPTFDDGWNAAIWYLKKRNGKPQNTWKPSDEQMKALDSAIDEFDGYPEFDSLVSLKNDLKKL